MSSALGADPAPSQSLEERLNAHIRHLANAGSRLTGYPGCAQAADYVVEQLRSYGIAEIHRHPFQAAVPVDQGAGLELEEYL